MSSPTKHALLSPSTSHRWLICTPSAFLEAQEPVTESIYAKEGTEAHALAELILSNKLGYISDKEFEIRYNQFKKDSEYYNQEFQEYVNSYVDKIMTLLKFDYKDIKVKVYLEEEVEFSDIVPEGKGTSDVVIVGQNFIHIIDLKFGKGVEVSAIDNPQLRLYALGAIRKHIGDCICANIKMTIIQPRLDAISTDFMSVLDLNQWAKDVVKPKALMAIAGQGELVAGEHCKFCRRRGKCLELSNRRLSEAQAEFEQDIMANMLEPVNMTPETLSRILKIAPKFIDWFKDVQAFAIKSAIYNDLEIPGFKIVEGRSTRKIISPESVAEVLRTNGFSEDMYMKPKELLGISTLERNIGKKVFNSLCGEYIIKPNGEPTLVPISDKREPIDKRQLRLDGSEFDQNE